MKMIEIEWYWIKIGLFRIYSELFFDYFAILIIFEVGRRRYSVFYKSVHVWHLDSIVLIRQALFPP